MTAAQCLKVTAKGRFEKGRLWLTTDDMHGSVLKSHGRHLLCSFELLIDCMCPRATACVSYCAESVIYSPSPMAEYARARARGPRSKVV